MALQIRLLTIFLVIVATLLVWANRESNPLPPDARADYVRICKAGHRLILFKDGKPLKVYRIALGRNPIGNKEREGDGRTPEGLYRIDAHKPDSTFHRALHISYPNADDLQAARGKGVNPGGSIMIHGIRKGLGWIGRLQNLVDWTAGCVAVTNPRIEEIYRAVPDGTPVEIRP
jgi:murein L,D-transpeptidase YafK